MYKLGYWLEQQALVWGKLCLRKSLKKKKERKILKKKKERKKNKTKTGDLKWIFMRQNSRTLKLNSYSNAKRFFIAFSHAWFPFAMRRFVFDVKKQNRACEKAIKKRFAFEYEFSFRPSLPECKHIHILQNQLIFEFCFLGSEVHIYNSILTRMLMFLS